MLTIKIERRGDILAKAEGEREVNLHVSIPYEEGDRILIEVPSQGGFFWVSVDEAVREALVYIKGERMEFTIPFGEKRCCYSPKAFFGSAHLLRVRKAERWEAEGYRNLALNPVDQPESGNCYPHAWANVETRGEAAFAARNAIDGLTANTSHGIWPYSSWGINRDPRAAIQIEFGRPVEVDRIRLYLRADFPHDNWWRKITAVFSDQSREILHPIKTGEGQSFTFARRRVEWVRLENLIPSDEPSPFPALTQIEVYGNVEC